ncbi:MAG TPA: prolipoprotein diacylglyceryl transferase family protein [Ktedonobacterales bacterium]|nr:prolipoprotein diacylglyceryl transferase family protein [Ktedonobacterales bacterium]
MARRSPSRTHPPQRLARAPAQPGATASVGKAIGKATPGATAKPGATTVTPIMKAVSDVTAASAKPISARPVSATTAQAPVKPKELPPQTTTPTQTEGAFKTLLERGMQEVLAVTYWFEPPAQTEPGPVTVRFIGRHVDSDEQLQPGDRFVWDETIERVIPGSGPLSLTAKIEGVTPGDWVVTASIVEAPRAAAERRAKQHTHYEQAQPTLGITSASSRLVRFWCQWAPVTAPTAEAATPVSTCLLPFARVPGLLPTGSWGALVGLGVVVALLTQALVLARSHVAAGSALAISLAAIAIGAVGAKLWYRIQYRHLHSWSGWCIQGFITGATVTVALLLALLRVPADAFLDATAPGLMFGMAIGRLGCFTAGCCGGPPTASRWGIWSSDQRVGARRIPTQLMESTLALTLGLSPLAVDLTHGFVGGGLFVAALAAYTLGRQGILRLRAEARKTKWGGIVTAAGAALLLVVALIYIGFHL